MWLVCCLTRRHLPLSDRSKLWWMLLHGAPGLVAIATALLVLQFGLPLLVVVGGNPVLPLANPSVCVLIRLLHLWL